MANENPKDERMPKVLCNHVMNCIGDINKFMKALIVAKTGSEGKPKPEIKWDSNLEKKFNIAYSSLAHSQLLLDYYILDELPSDSEAFQVVECSPDNPESHGSTPYTGEIKHRKDELIKYIGQFEKKCKPFKENPE